MANPTPESWYNKPSTGPDPNTWYNMAVEQPRDDTYSWAVRQQTPAWQEALRQNAAQQASRGMYRSTASLGQDARTNAQYAAAAETQGEQMRQFDKTFGEGQRQFNTGQGNWANTFNEGQRQYNTGQGNWQNTFNEGQRQYNTGYNKDVFELLSSIGLNIGQLQGSMKGVKMPVLGSSIAGLAGSVVTPTKKPTKAAKKGYTWKWSAAKNAWVQVKNAGDPFGDAPSATTGQDIGDPVSNPQTINSPAYVGPEFEMQASKDTRRDRASREAMLAQQIAAENERARQQIAWEREKQIKDLDAAMAAQGYVKVNGKYVQDPTAASALSPELWQKATEYAIAGASDADPNTAGVQRAATPDETAKLISALGINLPLLASQGNSQAADLMTYIYGPTAWQTNPTRIYDLPKNNPYGNAPVPWATSPQSVLPGNVSASVNGAAVAVAPAPNPLWTGSNEVVQVPPQNRLAGLRNWFENTPDSFSSGPFDNYIRSQAGIPTTTSPAVTNNWVKDPVWGGYR